LNKIKSYSTNHESLKKLKEDISREEVELAKKRQEENQTLNSISTFIRFEVKSHNAIKALTDFGIKVSHYITNKLNADKALTHQKSKISNDLKKPTLAQFRSYETSNNIDQLNLKVCTELSHIALKSDDLIKQTKIKADKINEQKETLNVRLKAMEELKVQVKNYTENREKLITNDAESRKEFEFIEAAKPQLEEVSKSKKAITSKINEVRNQREKKLREKNLEEDRNLLKQGEPCPLCGSLHHPYVHEYFNNVSALTKELENLENDERKYGTEIQSMEREINLHSGALEALQKEKSRIERQMKEQESVIAARKKQLDIQKVGKPGMIDVAIMELENSVRAINELDKVIATKRDLEDFKEAVDELVVRSREFEKAKEEVDLRYKGSNIRGDCDLLSEQVRSSKEAIQKSETNMHAAKNHVEELNKQQAEIESSLNMSLRSFGYPDILSSFQDILPDAEFNNLKHQLADLEANGKRIKALIQGANERKQQLVLSDDPTKSKEDLLEEINTTMHQIKEGRQNLEEYRVQQRENESRKNRIIRLKEQVDETRQANLKWELLNKYIGDAMGKNFSTFAQNLTLKKLITLANERLRKLNDRYLLDIPLEEEDDDLIIIDTYLGEERRSVKTLSGGETFIVSLALALALSDLASKNVKIESLFIDEGFGSLDPDALDTAISTVEELQIESNKTIGIISHIDSLKERIETQIQLEKNSSGFSRIVIR
jgi:exonuclease SbcC